VPITDEFEFLIVDRFLSTLIDSRTLKSAFELSLIDVLQRQQPLTFEQLSTSVPGDGQGLQLLVDLLRVNHVIECGPRGLTLTIPFQTALKFRDLLEARIDFANLVAPDVLEHFTLLLTDPAGFMRKSRLFDLFKYRHASVPAPGNEERTRVWMRYTTSLTRYESHACLRHHDFGRYEQMLDIGGNSGEFVLRLCQVHQRLRATVFDLPVVCAVGRKHVQAAADSNRITFVEGDVFRDPLPKGFDLVTFKSMLHDWPEREARRLLTQASQSLNLGGTLLIFERGPLRITDSPPYSLLPILLFFRSYRGPDFYRSHLLDIGFQDVHVESFDLESPFFLLTARLGQ
jgi:hypothetical protein